SRRRTTAPRARASASGRRARRRSSTSTARLERNSTTPARRSGRARTGGSCGFSSRRSGHRVAAMEKHLMVVFTDCHPGRDAEFDEWYTGTHIPDVLRLDGFVATRRYRLAAGSEGDDRTYLAIWEIEGDLDRAKAALSAGPPRAHSPAYDPSKTVVRFYTAITDRIE